MTDVSVGFRPPCWCPSGWAPTWRPIQISLNLGDTLLRIAHELKTAETWFLARFLYCNHLSYPRYLEFMYWTVTIFSFDHMTDENREYRFYILSRKTMNTRENFCNVYCFATSQIRDETAKDNRLTSFPGTRLITAKPQHGVVTTWQRAGCFFLDKSSCLPLSNAERVLFLFQLTYQQIHTYIHTLYIHTYILYTYILNLFIHGNLAYG